MAPVVELSFLVDIAGFIVSGVGGQIIFIVGLAAGVPLAVVFIASETWQVICASTLLLLNKCLYQCNDAPKGLIFSGIFGDLALLGTDKFRRALFLGISTGISLIRGSGSGFKSASLRDFRPTVRSRKRYDAIGIANTLSNPLKLNYHKSFAHFQGKIF